MIAPRQCECVLFDLDGTLVDTAPDMVAVLNRLRAELGRPPLSLETMRVYVSRGAMGLLNAGLEDDDKVSLESHQRRFLALYAAALCEHSQLFEGLAPTLAALESLSIPWGVVTNKPEGLARPLLRELGLLPRLACFVGGDTLAHRKPHPLPLLHACRNVGVDPERTVYIGDDERDVVAGRAAGCRTMVAQYGYIFPGSDPASWGADEIALSPRQVGYLLGVTEVAS